MVGGIVGWWGTDESEVEGEEGGGTRQEEGGGDRTTGYYKRPESVQMQDRGCRCCVKKNPMEKQNGKFLKFLPRTPASSLQQPPPSPIAAGRKRNEQANHNSSSAEQFGDDGGSGGAQSKKPGREQGKRKPN